MKRSLLLLVTLAFLSCSGGTPAPEETEAAEATTATASETSTAGGYVENVTRAQAKAKEMSAEEGKRVEEVDEAMTDQ